MLLIRGELWEDSRMEEAMADLERYLTRTVSQPLLDPVLVVDACDKLANAVANGEYADELDAFLLMHEVPRTMVDDAIDLFRRESLLYKLKMELGEETLEPLRTGAHVWQRRRFPLGVLFHIAAGNVDGLPAYSVVEGLLAGNINLLKLPSADGGLSVRLLHALTQVEPALADYIYVFDLPSTDLEGLTRLADLSDGEFALFYFFVAILCIAFAIFFCSVLAFSAAMHLSAQPRTVALSSTVLPSVCLIVMV